MEKKHKENQYKFWQELLNGGKPSKPKDNLPVDIIEKYLDKGSFSFGVDERVFEKAYVASQRARKSKSRILKISFFAVVLFAVLVSALLLGNMFSKRKKIIQVPTPYLSIYPEVTISPEILPVQSVEPNSSNEELPTPMPEVGELSSSIVVDKPEENAPDESFIYPQPSLHVKEATLVSSPTQIAITEADSQAVDREGEIATLSESRISGFPLELEGDCKIEGICTWFSNKMEPAIFYAVYLPNPKATDPINTNAILTIDVYSQGPLNKSQTYAIEQCYSDLCFIGLVMANESGSFKLDAKINHDLMSLISMPVKIISFPIKKGTLVQDPIKDVLLIVETDDDTSFCGFGDCVVIGKAASSYPLANLNRITLTMDNENQDLQLYMMKPDEVGQVELNDLKPLVKDGSNWIISDVYPEGSCIILTSPTPIDIFGSFLLVTISDLH